MRRWFFVVSLLTGLAGSLTSVNAREWSDAQGVYSIEAELFSSDGELVVLAGSVRRVSR
jgi:hypothetical protein